ncbi:MAG: phytoene desaturase [Candidatus Altiarchaeota archaeon]|nr:phytoene desaturase [Candidatus Altiarchaeota archaeon]
MPSNYILVGERTVSGKKAVVIGAGFGGLAAATLLAKKGFDVTVLEKNEQAGGRARVYCEKGFVFDMGPSWYLMPEAFEKFFAEFDKKPSDLYRLKRLDPMYRVFYGPGDYLDIVSDLGRNMELFSSLEKDGYSKLKGYLAQAKYKYDTAMEEFIYREYKSIFDFFSPKLISKGFSLHLFDRLDSFVKGFFSNERLIKILEYTMVFLGSDPRNTPALYSIMSHVDLKLGVWYPEEGIGAVVSAMLSLAESYGVKFCFNSEVEKIVVEKGVAREVLSKKGSFEADFVVVNSDYPFSEARFLEPKYQTYPPKYWKKKVIGPSAFIIYIGLNKRLSGLVHHNLFFAPDWFKHFDSIFKKPEWPEDPSYYVSCPSKTDSTVAPEGCENLFILVPVASGLEDSDEKREDYYDGVVSHLEGLLGETIRDSVVVKRIYSHRDFYRDYNSYQGNALGLAHTLFQTAYFRPKHKSRKVRNLYYVGHYTHPGVGVPMSIISSQIVADELLKDGT